MIRRILLIFATLTGAVFAQQGNTLTFHGAGAPTGSCSFMFFYVNDSNGDFYNCLNGSWNKVTSVGGGGNVSTTQTNVYGAFLQDFSAATMELPEAAAFVTTVDSTIGIDTNTGIMHVWGPGSADSFNVVTSSTSTTATQVLHATATAGLYVPSAIATGDLPTSAIPNVAYLNAANTYTTAGTGDFSACTVANCLKVPVGAGLTSGANGAIAYDSTNGNTHIRAGGADAIAGAFASTPSNGNVVSTFVTGATLLTDAGFAATNVVRKDAANTAGSAFTLDATGATGANPIRVQSKAGATATTAGAITYDSTTGLPHVAVNAVDATTIAAPARVSATAQTAAIGTTTLCTALQCPANPGHYEVHWEFTGGGTACSSVTVGSVTFLLTWTDENAVTHSAVSLQMMAQTGAATTAMGSTFPFQTALANEGASGTFGISTNGTIIQYATGYTACTTGTGTYSIRAEVTRMQ